LDIGAQVTLIKGMFKTGSQGHPASALARHLSKGILPYEYMA